MRRLILTSHPASPLAGTVLALLLVSGPMHAQTATSAIRMEGYPAPGAPPTVTLISAGAEPKRQIPFGPAAVRKEHMDITMKMGMSIEAAGQMMPQMDLPALVIGMDLGVTEIKPNGEFTVSLAMTGMKSASAAPDPVFDQMLGETNAQLKTFKGTITFDARGQLLSQDLDLDKIPTAPGMESMRSSLKESLKNVAPAMPEGPLGLGARWEVRRAVDSGGIVMFQKGLNEITAIDPDSVTIKTSLEQTSPPQAMTAPGLPPGADMRLESGNATGSGTTVVRFGEIVPASDANIKVTMKVMVTVNGQTLPMTMTITIDTKMAGTPIK